ncbi:MAG: bifunctional folylpolyglutamate synthase/dihydrofolate synthase [Gammaproteobacteria bacterium]|nr:bifunctional folylpolyglutamate synthase/dihydrofolate synthase [Gammaproteobacteria bacterium]
MNTLSAWERYIETLAPPSQIELGLERIGQVWNSLTQVAPSQVITVAGTNGKGSTVEAAGVLAQAEGLTYGQYTSPHIHAIQERIRVNGTQVSDHELVGAFEIIESARGSIFLTYFEFLTLAAFVIFERRDLDLWILEIGLGGRLDAVNIIDPSVSIITSIGLDHQLFLGDNIESIAREKAGVMRSSTPTLTAATNVRAVLEAEALACKAQLVWLDTALEHDKLSILASGEQIDLSGIQLPRDAVALACLAFGRLGYGLTQAIEEPLSRRILPGRMSRHMVSDRSWILDVGHNPAACKFVISTLAQSISEDRRVVVFGALIDKDVDAMLPILRAFTSRIVLVGISSDRGRDVESLENSWYLLFAQTCWRSFATIEDALEGLPSELNSEDQVLVIGSFLLVADSLKHDLFN